MKYQLDIALVTYGNPEPTVAVKVADVLDWLDSALPYLHIDHYEAHVEQIPPLTEMPTNSIFVST